MTDTITKATHRRLMPALLARLGVAPIVLDQGPVGDTPMTSLRLSVLP